MDLGAHLRLGRGEEQSGGRRKPALLANALEAVIGALYLDGGLDVARPFIEKHIIEPALPDLHLALQASETFSEPSATTNPPFRSASRPPEQVNPSTFSPHRAGPTIKNASVSKSASKTKRESPAPLAESEGTTKKQAQQEAARLAFQRLVAESQIADASVAEVAE